MSETPTSSAEKDAGTRHGPCICNTGPGTEGPDELCPHHGRTYNELLAYVDDEFKRLRAAVGRVEALADEWGRVPNGFGLQGPVFRQAATLLRAALDTSVIPPPADRGGTDE